MKIEFTLHAKDKFLILREHGFPVDEELVADTVKKPDTVIRGRKKRLIAQKLIDEKHLLRVIYEIRSGKIVVITFYPARRDRFEDQV